MLTDEQLNHIKALTDHATQRHLRFNRYDHGGGRMFSEQTPEHTRRLIIDAFNERDREFYFAALENMQVLLTEVERLRAELKMMKPLAEAARRFDAENDSPATLSAEQREASLIRLRFAVFEFALAERIAADMERAQAQPKS